MFFVRTIFLTDIWRGHIRLSPALSMSLDQPETDASSRQWPGERQPTRWDVHDANESPASTFLDRFRAALLLSEGAEEALLEFDPLIDDYESLPPPVSVLHSIVMV